MENTAVWIDGPAQQPRIGPAPVPEPGEGELLIRVKAIPAQPGEWKLPAGLIPIPLNYPTIIGVSLSGIVEKAGAGVTRFKPGDRVATNTTGVLRNDHRFGAYQRYALAPQGLTSKIGETEFEEAASIVTGYGCASALCLHLGLEKPPTRSVAARRDETVLIWGVSSSFGAISVQLALQAGYTVVGVASARHAVLTNGFGLSYFVDRSSPNVVQELSALGPFKAVLAAADSAEDQVKIGDVLAAQGGGRFLTATGVRTGVRLPEGVTGSFHQFADDYLDPKNAQFTEWFWWEYLEAAFADRRLKSLPLQVELGLSKVLVAWNLLRQGKVSGKRLIIVPTRE
ncbi:uncharacterized protein A1O5_10801 [Cladophialophora psammophila CBS 110553]|uniref:Enoyl reductase (ER) domain-containing protein n=1 Tax=Cladophialophora psammophila CBS 110553 TaxID=1182543 RepID=W9WME8_9EURO|nr:uncharacterized protein A1O5_10801 [Cladophialophora psammophila CBS 110553]EXJ66185.1 hypothetical protein A1O5_10801 [Cladophialophora psammophila CBS 110553]